MFTIDGQTVDLKKASNLSAQIKLKPNGHITIGGVTVRNDTNEVKTVAELAALKGA